MADHKHIWASLLVPKLALPSPPHLPKPYAGPFWCWPLSARLIHLMAPLSALPENGAFFCNECDCRFSEEASLKRHSLQVHSDKPYKCDRCQASFRYKGNLASHKTVHTGTATSWGGCQGLGCVSVRAELIYCKALGFSKGCLHNAWLGADVWPPGHFVVDLKENNHLGEKKSVCFVRCFFFFFIHPRNPDPI